MAKSYPNQWKTLWEKEKLLVTSNFTFSQCFQKACFPEASKGFIVWEWVKQYIVLTTLPDGPGKVFIMSLFEREGLYCFVHDGLAVSPNYTLSR